MHESLENRALSQTCKNISRYAYSYRMILDLISKNEIRMPRWIHSRSARGWLMQWMELLWFWFRVNVQVYRRGSTLFIERTFSVENLKIINVCQKQADTCQNNFTFLVKFIATRNMCGSWRTLRRTRSAEKKLSLFRRSNFKRVELARSNKIAINSDRSDCDKEFKILSPAFLPLILCTEIRRSLF